MHRKRLAWALAALLLIAVSVPAADAQDAAGQAEPKKAQKIRIRADSLEVDNEARTAEFSGHVTASQGDTVIQSHRLRVHYKADAAGGEGQTSGEDVIERIVAEGEVSIQFDDKVAKTDRAVYTTMDRVLVLSGPGSTVTSGRNAISGSTISVDRRTGRIRVEGGEKSAVEAVFYPGDQGID